MPPTHRQGSITTVTAAALLLLGACAGAPSPDAYRQSAFLDGKVNLDCTDFPCALRWRMNADDLRAHYANREWDALAAAVTNTQYGSDLAYFYLGRAAEELHRYRAAQHYFEQAMATPERCGAGVFSACDGVDLPGAAQRHGERIAGMLSEPPMDSVAAQTMLAQLGLYDAAIDGISGPRTRAAIRQFQERRGMAVSGELDAMTSAVLAGVAAEEDRSQAQVAMKAAAEAQQDSATIGNTVNAPVDTPTNDGVSVAPSRDSAPPAQVARGSRRVASVEAADTRPDRAATEAAELDSEGGPPAVAAAEGGIPDPGTMISEPVARPEPSPAVAASAASDERDDTPHQRSRVTMEVELLSDADPFAEVVAVVTQGTWVDIINRGSEWSKISHRDKTGFVYTDFLQ